jgi:hypothetical protein
MNRNEEKPVKAVLRIPDPDFNPSRISDPGSRVPDPKTAMKDRGEKKFVPILFFGAINCTKLNYFIFEMLKKKNFGQFQRIIELFTQKIVTKHSKIWVWDPCSGIRDPGSEIRDPEKTHSGSRIQGSKRHRIRIWIRNTE